MLNRRFALPVLFAFASAALAQGNFPNETPSLNRKVRNLGMGNVGVAIRGTHDSAPFYNPAGLNDLEKGRFQFFSPTVEMSKSAIDLVSDVKDLLSDLEDADGSADKTRVFNEFGFKNSGEFRRMRFALDVFNYARKNFAAGVLIDERFDLAVREFGSNPQLNVRNLGDAAFYVAGATDFWDKMVQVGVTVKPTVRFAINEADEVVDYSDIQDGSDGDPLLKDQFSNIKDRRFGLGVDLGLKSNLALPAWKDASWYKAVAPAVGVTWQDIGSPDFGRAPGNAQSMNVGAAIHPDLWKIKNTIGLDVRELNRDRDFVSKLHFGVESKLPWILALRAGLSQGYVTGGATMDLWFVKLDGAIYYEEVGIYGKNQGNLRWAANLSFNI